MSRQAVVRLVTALLALVAAVSLGSTASAQAPTAAKTSSPGTSKTTYSPPRTLWGDPDLQGIWTNVNEARTPMNRPEELAKLNVTDPESPEHLSQKHARGDVEDAAYLKSLNSLPVPGGPRHWYEALNARASRLWQVIDPPDFKVPSLTPEAQKRREAYRKLRQGVGEDEPLPGGWVDDFRPWQRCITRTLPPMYSPVGYNANYQIVQGPGYVIVLAEMIHEARVIPVDGRPHVPSNVRQWLGDSVGRWEGDTLVVDTTNFNDKYFFGQEGYDENLHVIERFSRLGPDRIDRIVTIDDPTGWTKPWTYATRWTKDDSQKQIFEYACHEGNLSVPHTLSGARAKEAEEEATKKRP